MDSIAPAPAPAMEAPRPRPLYFRYDGSKGDIARIAVVNTLLNVLTLGVYRFWAKTRMRRYLWGRLALAGDRLEYTGRGLELLIGFLVALAILVPFLAVHVLATMLIAPDSGWRTLEEGVYLLAIWFLVNVAVFRARRYRLTRTRWRGIRFAQTGSASAYALMVMGWQLLVVLSLGLAYPFYRAFRQRYLIDNTRFGDKSLRFEGRGGRLFGVWFMSWLLMIPTLWLSYLWYRVREFNYFAEATRFRGLQVSADLGTGRVLSILIGYALLLLFLLAAGFAAFWILVPDLLSDFAQHSNGDTAALPRQSMADALTFVVIVAVLVSAMGVARFIALIHPMAVALAQAVTLSGHIDFDDLAQAQGQMPGRGEGLVEVLDVGSF